METRKKKLRGIAPPPPVQLRGFIDDFTSRGPKQRHYPWILVSREPFRDLVPLILGRACYQCDARGRMKICGRCRLARYCSVECQRAAYLAHRDECLKSADGIVGIWASARDTCGSCGAGTARAAVSVGTRDCLVQLCGACFARHEAELQAHKAPCCVCGARKMAMLLIPSMNPPLLAPFCDECYDKVLKARAEVPARVWKSLKRVTREWKPAAQ